MEPFFEVITIACASAAIVGALILLVWFISFVSDTNQTGRRVAAIMDRLGLEEKNGEPIANLKEKKE
jgi:hypothetical protein